MLSRTADHLFWMARYMERAENTARMLDVNYQTSLLPQSAEAAQKGWQGLLSISELTQAYQQRHGAIGGRKVLEFMVRDEANPSTILSCLRAARENARAVRGTLTTEVWETQNQTWLEFNRMLQDGAFERDPGNVARAVRDLGVTWPVALDDRYETWNAFANQVWPAEYLIDRRGRLRHLQLGEGDGVLPPPGGIDVGPDDEDRALRRGDPLREFLHRRGVGARPGDDRAARLRPAPARVGALRGRCHARSLALRGQCV